MEATASPVTDVRSVHRMCLGIGLIVALSCLRLAHVQLLWADEDYHLAAALQILHGKVPYRDFWYDKPPLNALYYVLIGGFSGWLLRVLDVFYVLLACYLAYRLASRWWSEAEGWASATLLAFFMAFYLPSAVISFAADALMLVPHLAAVYAARKGSAFWAGAFSGIAFLVNTKGVFVLAVCGVWMISEVPLLLAGFVAPIATAGVCGWAAGAWPGYVEQVWRWGLLYATRSPVTHPFLNGFSRTTNWLGFHLALLVGTAFAFVRISREDRFKLASWLLISFAAVCLGSRFAPHYFLQLLPPMLVAASRGVVLGLREHRKVAAGTLFLLTLVPIIRFGPRYASLMIDDIRHIDPHWSDVAMDLDSRDAARRVRGLARPGDSLFVWGYRPDLYVYTRMVSDSRFWDSQPLTGVPADRHLLAISAIYGGAAASNRVELTRSHPTWIVDGLGLLNPKLRPSVYPELRTWLAGYKLTDRTKLCLIYRKIGD